MPFAPHSRLGSLHRELRDSSEFLKPMCERRWHRTNQGGEIAARTMSAEIRLFVAVAAAVERGPISKWKTDRLGMRHKLPRLKSGVPAGRLSARD
jgi:hypothetical protein